MIVKARYGSHLHGEIKFCLMCFFFFFKPDHNIYSLLKLTALL